MSDFDSSLPVRTQSNGDVVAFIADGTVSTQLLNVDAAGKLTSKLNDGAGNSITSQVNGAQQALDVGINVAGVQIDPRQIRALTAADIVTVQQGTSPWVTKDQADGPVAPGAVASFSQLMGGQFNTVLPTLTNTQQAAVQVDSSGRIIISPLTSTSVVTVSNLPTTVDTNYGTVGASTIRTAAQIGNATGAADFNFGAGGAQTLRVASIVGNSTGAADFNYGTVGAQTLRTASQIGNATGAASFNAGATTAQTLRVASNLYDSTGTPFSTTNPLPVTFVDSPGTAVNDYKDAASIGVGATDNHDYTVTAGKTLHLNQIESSGSGKAKMIVSVETGVATGVFTVRFVQFNSTAETNMGIVLKNPIDVAAGVRVRVAMSNRDLLPQDLYSTISGFEV